MTQKLTTLARLRRLQTIEARRDLAQAAAAERQAEAALAGAQDTVTCEAGVDDVPGAFGQWLPRGAAAVNRATAGLGTAEQAVHRARALYAANRRAEDAVHAIIDERREAARRRADRKAEQQMGDLTRGGARRGAE